MHSGSFAECARRRDSALSMVDKENLEKNQYPNLTADTPYTAKRQHLCPAATID